MDNLQALFHRKEVLERQIERAQRAKRKARELFQVLVRVNLRNGRNPGSLYDRLYGMNPDYVRALSALERLGW